MADALGDLGEPVPDRTLVLNVIRGLNERLASIGLHLRRGRPLPTFLEVRNDPLLEEPTLAHHSIVPALLFSPLPPTSPRPTSRSHRLHIIPLATPSARRVEAREAGVAPVLSPNNMG
jgi:hypothetical protein